MRLRRHYEVADSTAKSNNAIQRLMSVIYWRLSLVSGASLKKYQSASCRGESTHSINGTADDPTQSQHEICTSDDELLTIRFNDVYDEVMLEDNEMFNDIHSKANKETNSSQSIDDIKTPNGGDISYEEDQDNENRKPTLSEHVLITLSMWGITALIAIFSSDLGVVLALTGNISEWLPMPYQSRRMYFPSCPVGAVAASALGYIIPVLLYIETYRHEFVIAASSFYRSSPHYTTSIHERYYRMKRFMLPIAMLIFGIVAMIAGVVTVFASA